MEEIISYIGNIIILKTGYDGNYKQYYKKLYNVLNSKCINIKQIYRRSLLKETHEELKNNRQNMKKYYQEKIL